MASRQGDEHAMTATAERDGLRRGARSRRLRNAQLEPRAMRRCKSHRCEDAAARAAWKLLAQWPLEPTEQCDDGNTARRRLQRTCTAEFDRPCAGDEVERFSLPSPARGLFASIRNRRRPADSGRKHGLPGLELAGTHSCIASSTATGSSKRSWIALIPRNSRMGARALAGQSRRWDAIAASTRPGECGRGRCVQHRGGEWLSKASVSQPGAVGRQTVRVPSYNEGSRSPATRAVSRTATRETASRGIGLCGGFESPTKQSVTNGDDPRSRRAANATRESIDVTYLMVWASPARASAYIFRREANVQHERN